MLVKKLKETFEQYDGQSITLQGWVRTNRNSKAVGFIALNDGTTFSNVTGATRCRTFILLPNSAKLTKNEKQVCK